MIMRFLIAVSVALASTSVGLAQSSAQKMAPQKGWLFDLAQAKAVARKTGKPLMVVFRCDP
jgi:hypothetical protein